MYTIYFSPICTNGFRPSHAPYLNTQTELLHYAKYDQQVHIQICKFTVFQAAQPPTFFGHLLWQSSVRCSLKDILYNISHNESSVYGHESFRDSSLNQNSMYVPARKTYYETASLTARFAFVSITSCHRPSTDRQERLYWYLLHRDKPAFVFCFLRLFNDVSCTAEVTYRIVKGNNYEGHLQLLVYT